LTAKGQKIMANMARQYGPDKGERVFYASRNAGRITGVDPGHAYGGFVYQRGGLVDHPHDPDLPPVQDDAQLVPLMQHQVEPPYLATIRRLIAAQQRLNQMPLHPLQRELLRRYWLGGYVPGFWRGGFIV
jgi:hypothetical protein